MERSWPLVGRGEEVALLDRAVRSADGPRGMVLAGAAGVGKTRLAHEAVRIAQAEGLSTHWVSATTSSRALPLGALAMVVGDVGSDPTQVLQRAADRLVAGAGSTGPLLVVDDAHHLDDLSAALVQQLVVQRKASLVLTVRSGEQPPDAVESVWKDGFLGRVELQALSRGETGALLARVLGGPVEDRSVRRLFDLTGGNALYLRHVVDGEVDAGRLRAVAGGWRWEGDFAASDPLADLVDRRLVGLSPDVLDVLDVLAVAGGLDFDVLASVVSPGSIEQAEAAGVIQVASQSGSLVVRLAHPLYGEVRGRRLGRLRTRRLRGLVATALDELRSHVGSEVLRRGVLSLDSDLAPDSALLTAAAQSALRLLDWGLGVRLATAAVRVGGGFEASLTLSYALAFGVDPVLADDVLAELVSTADDDLERLRASLPRAGHLFYMQARPTDAIRVLTEVRADLGDVALVPPVDGMLAMFEAMAGDPLEGVRLAREALDGSPLAPLPDLCAIWALVVGLGTTGRLDEFPDEAARKHEAAETSYESSMPSIGYAYLHNLALRLHGSVREAERVAQRFQTDIRDLTAITSMFVDGIAGEAAIAAGRVRSARVLEERASAGLRGGSVGPSGWSYCSSISLTKAYAMAGDGAAALAAATVMDDDRHPGFACMEPDRLLAWAWARAANGSVGEAVDLAHQAAAAAVGKGQWGYEVFALATAVRFGDPSVAARIEELAGVVDRPRAPAATLHARALADGDGDGLIGASRAFEVMGDLLSAADAAAQATTALREAGLLGSANSAMARAARLQEACEGAVTPALRVALHPLPLTDREREMVTLAADGLTNREIADRLVVSVRTVEGHLYRAGAKLGTNQRAEFRALLTGE